MSAFVKVDVKPDTPEWEAERRGSVGASDVAAIMGLSPYDVTALDVYRSKLGIERRFDALLGWIGHKSEQIIEDWVHEWSGLDVELQPGFMARSVEWPFLHATFDRVASRPFTTFQFKTAHQYAGHHWDEGVPDDIRVQVQAEMAVAGTPRACVVVWIGGRDFRLFWEDRDDAFIRDYLIPAVEQFWFGHVRPRVEPPPMTVRDVNSLPTEPAAETDISDAAFEALEQYAVVSSDIAALEEQRKQLKVAIARYVGAAEVLKYRGRKVATYRMQRGRVGFDKAAFVAEHPDLFRKYQTVGEPFRVLRLTMPKEANK